jgi:poly(3-hydroxyalkanoate) synthetase
MIAIYERETIHGQMYTIVERAVPFKRKVWEVRIGHFGAVVHGPTSKKRCYDYLATLRNAAAR